jgi:hypothetical protein
VGGEENIMFWEGREKKEIVRKTDEDENKEDRQSW